MLPGLDMACSLRPRVQRCTSSGCTPYTAWPTAPAFCCGRSRRAEVSWARSGKRPLTAVASHCALLERVSLSEPQNSIVPAPIILPARRTDDVLHDNGNEPAVPLFVSLSDEVCRACQQQPEAARGALKALKVLGAWGVTINVWWGAVELSPGSYDWAPLASVINIAEDVGLRVKVSLCFHGDDSHKLPLWLQHLGEQCPDIWYTDKAGNRSTNCLTLGIDHVPVLLGRTALQVYRDFMVSFQQQFAGQMQSTITDIDVGLGPKGELRYPSMDQRWAFPGIGEFQCYDRFMLSSLAACAQQVGQPHWGTSGPHDAGSYCQWPHQTGFFHHQGSWTSEYGHFFLQWYTQQLLRHGDNVLREAASVFGGSGVRLYARLPVIFWWYNQAAHAAELTAGWYNTADRDGYLPALQILADHGVGLQLAAGELRDCEQPGNALASPEHLLLQLRAGAAALNVPVLLTNYGSGFEQHLLSELERKAFEGTCYMGVDIEPAAGLQFNSMNDIMFESQHWGVFKDWLSRVRRRAQELAEAQQQLRVPGSSSGSRHEQRPRLPSRQGTVSSAQLVQEAGQLQQQAAAAAAAQQQQQQRQAAVYV